MGKTDKKAVKYILPATAMLILLIFLTAGFRMLRFVMYRGTSGFYHPYISAVQKAAGGVRDTRLLNYSREELALRVEQLTNRNRELASRGILAASLLDDNRNLRKKLSLSPPPEWEFKVVEVILRDPLRFRKSFTVNCGVRDGISSGDAVVETTADGNLLLVGVVGECNARTANVITLADPELKVSGKIHSNGAIGFTNNGSTALRENEIGFGMLPVRDDYIHGEVVTTTGFEQSIPAGIKIGELRPVGDVVSRANENIAEFNCALAAAVKFETLRFAVIISRKKNVDDVK